MADELRVVGRTRLTTRGEYSASVTLPPEALDESGIEVDVRLMVSAGDGVLIACADPERDFDGAEPVDLRTVREQGAASLYVTIPKDAVETAGFEMGGYLQAEAADGVVRLTRW